MWLKSCELGWLAWHSERQEHAVELHKQRDNMDIDCPFGCSRRLERDKTRNTVPA